MIGLWRASQSRSVLRDTLIAVVTDPDAASDRLRALGPDDLTMVLKHGTAQKLGSALVPCLRAASLPVPAWLDEHRFDVATRNAVIMNALTTIAPALNESGIPWVVLKGPVTASSFELPHLREFGDLDLLVPGARLADTIEALAEIGIDDMNRNWEPYVKYGVAEFPMFIASAPIDMHWHLIGLATIRKQFEIDINELLDRRQPVTFGVTACHRLDSVDQLIHVALHAGLSGAGTFGMLRDVHETVKANDIDWNELVSRASSTRVGPTVGHVLDRCVHVLGSPVPPNIPERMTSRSALSLRRWLDNRSHPWGDPSATAYSGFVVSVAGQGMLTSVARSSNDARERLSLTGSRAIRWSAFDSQGPLFWASNSGTFGAYADMARNQT